MLDLPLSVLIPAYNEEQHIGRNIGRLRAYLKKHFRTFEIIICENGSTDRTWQAACKLRSKTIRAIQTQKGIYHALNAGQAAARYAYAAYYPVDDAFSYDFLPQAALIAKKYDVIIGSKTHPESDVRRPPLRHLASNVFDIAVSLKYGLKPRGGGVMLWNVQKLRPSFSGVSTDSAIYQVAILSKATKAGLRIGELPVKVNDTRKGGYFSLKNVTRSLVHLVRE